MNTSFSPLSGPTSATTPAEGAKPVLLTAEEAVIVAIADAEERVNQTVYPGSAFTETIVVPFVKTAKRGVLR